MKKKCTFAIGIDGACWEYIDPLIKSEKLPNIKRLITNGRRGITKSTLPHISSVAWSSFITGKDPKNNGIFDWCVKKDNSQQFRPVYSEDRVGKPFWHYLSESGLRVGIYNIPLTFPPEKVNGFFISGFDSPADGSRRTFPREIYEKYSLKYGKSFLYPSDRELTKTELGQQKYIAEYIEHINKQTLVALELIETYKIDVFIINYMIVDHSNHRIRDFTLVEKAIRAVDHNIGKFLEKYVILQ